MPVEHHRLAGAERRLPAELGHDVEPAQPARRAGVQGVNNGG